MYTKEPQGKVLLIIPAGWRDDHVSKQLLVRAGQGRGRAGQGRAGGGQGRAGQEEGRAGQGRAGQGSARQGSR